MKVFISHKNEDALVALQVCNALKSAGADSYLDVLDNNIAQDGEKLTKHIREKLRECTEIIVVLSSRTKTSWWVPFEIGMAAEKDMPIVNYLTSEETLPSYLSYWPRLKTLQDISKYVAARRKVANETRTLYESIYRADSRKSETERFYAELKKNL